MYTPPRLSHEVSWLRDQSPVHVEARTPQHSKTPENGTPTLVNPASTLLQDLLKEQRAHRGSRGIISDDWVDSAPRTPEGPRGHEGTESENPRKINDVFAAGLRQPKEMGMREMDQYVSKMNKLNFDLKLEIFHRTQQMSTLEKKLARMQEMEEELQQMHRLEEEVEELRAAEKENCSLREANAQLQTELDKRNVAVTEAVQLICQLEAKIEELESGGRTSQMSMNRLVLDGPQATTPKAQTAIQIPERSSSKRGSATKTRSIQQRSSELHQITKAPSFLRTDNHSTATLRSLYAPDINHSCTGMSELTKSESFHTMNMTEAGSPRLSVLSECSELNPFDTPSRFHEFDKLDIPVRKASSTTGSLDSYNPAERDEKEDQIGRWMQSGPDMSQTIIRRRQNRAMSDASKGSVPAFIGDLYSSKPRGRPRLDAGLFGGARLPPTPDTMSTACAPVNNGSNGSIAAQKSPKVEREAWFAGPPIDRHRSAGDLITKRSFNGSEVSDSMQTNCSDTPRLGATNDGSPTFLPFNSFNHVASKASELLGPGSPNNPAVKSFTDLCHQDGGDKAAPLTINRGHTPTKVMTPEPDLVDRWNTPSPPLTPTDWVAAAKQAPRSRKHPDLPRNVISQAAFHDDHSVISNITEPDGPGIPTLDMNILDILEQPFAEVPISPQVQNEPEPEPRRRFSFRPAFFKRSNTGQSPQSSPIANDFADEEDDGAPSPIIPKTRNAGGARRRPVSQIIVPSTDLYSSSLPITKVAFDDNFTSRPSNQSLVETREKLASLENGAATISGRPTTSHSMENHKRRSSFGIFGWMKGVSGKRSEPATPAFPDKFNEQEPRAPSHLAQDDPAPRSATPDSIMDASVVRPRSQTTMHSEDHGRRPRYMGRRSRRL
ncbi:hypothetical protein N7462_007746 [Penicillium macrosclerotiorum]|uniref:uncharacterized protein n=1 Tax=Penicillium macrosclerotiorum TaxID=303699 RepID=UPI002548FCA4|nr:uncharacterized protein N7462_007746 [Penicillium macrosclerotiorum]KAJ5679502.1 hypothetical protein N7462_007746 [Penicillium macrosclerotiorum]